MLDILINRAKDDGHILHLIDGRLSILQYAHDTLIFMDHNLEKKNRDIKLLCAFVQVSDLRID